MRAAAAGDEVIVIAVPRFAIGVSVSRSGDMPMLSLPRPILFVCLPLLLAGCLPLVEKAGTVFSSTAPRSLAEGLGHALTSHSGTASLQTGNEN
jgi:hypothetical protein